MKIINSKNAGLLLLTAVLSMSLTHVIASDEGVSRQDSPSPFGAGQDPDTGEAHDTATQKTIIRDMDQNQGAATEEVSTDSTITNEVNSGFSNHNDLRDTNIDVKTESGEVSLSGEVSTEAQRDMAISKAKEIKGVKNVNSDDLKIRD